MPKFSQHEMESIHDELLKQGKILFANYGLKKTSIDDIVNSCHIGKGTFYRFFQSKEELYFKILEQEEKFRIRLIEDMFQSKKPPKEAFKDFLLSSLEYIENNQFLSSVLERQDIELLYRKLPKESLNKHFKSDLKDVLIIVEKWKQQNVLKEEDPEIITGILQSIFLIYTYKNELGNGFTKSFHKLIDYIVDGIFL